MIVDGVRPACKSCILRTRSPFDCPASEGIPPWLTPLVPWQLAQLEAMLRATLGSACCAYAAPAAQASARNANGRRCTVISPGLDERRNYPASTPLLRRE